MADITVAEISREISKTILKQLLPRVRKIVREEVISAKKDIIIEVLKNKKPVIGGSNPFGDYDGEDDEDDIDEIISPRKKKVRNGRSPEQIAEATKRARLKAASFLKKQGDPFADQVSSAGEFDPPSPETLDESTVINAGSKSIREVEEAAAEGSYVDPSAINYDEVLTDL